MSGGEFDEVSGHRTTGHEWNGIRELDTPVPRGILIFIVVTHLFALLWWILYPAWPLIDTYTPGVLGTDQHERVAEDLAEAAASREPWAERIAALSYEEIRADPALMEVVRDTGHRLFGDNCAACHGRDARGGRNFPDLTDDDWIWGGEPEDIAETLRVGINTLHPESRAGQMPAFGRDTILDRGQVRQVASYVYALTHPEWSTTQTVDAIEAGRELFAANCTPCHGEDARGSREVGAPDLTDGAWIYGGELTDIIASIHGGRQGHMPTWERRLTGTEIRILALYVHDLGTRTP